MTVVRKVTAAQQAAGSDALEYVISDGSLDRYGTVINPAGWDLTEFRKNPIAFFNHNKDFPIGVWDDIRVEGGRLMGRLRLATEGTSARIDEIIRLVRQGIVKAVSVGFSPKTKEPLKRSDGTPVPGGVHYLSQELLEASLVGVGGNVNALQVARSLNISDETIDLVFGKHAGTHETVTRGSNAKHGETPPPRKALAVNIPLSKRIEDAQARLVVLQDDLTNHLDTVDDNNPDETIDAMTSEKSGKVAAQKRSLAALQEAEQRLISDSVPAVNHHGGVAALPRRHFESAPKIRDGEYYMRTLVATVVARARGWRPGLDSPDPFFRALAERYGEDGKVDEKTRAIADVVLREDSERCIALDVFMRSYGGGNGNGGGNGVVYRAASAPATTTTSGWASQLVNTGYADFLNLLLPASVFPGLAARAMRLTFGRNGVISIPSRVATPTIGGSFVAEGSPIPVRQGAVTSQTFTPKKMGVISAFTREIAEHSTPAIEALIRQWMQEDTSVSLDSVLLDATAASTTRPAGIRNGVAALTATTGGGFTALVADIKQLTGALLTATNNNLRNPVWLMNPQQQLSIAMTQTTTGDFPFKAEINQNTLANYPVIVSGNVTAGMVIVLDAADFAVIEAGAPRFDVSDQAVLHFEDTTPLAIGTAGSPPTVAAPVRSLWQTDSMAVRMILDVNWGFVRSGAIAWVTAVTW